MDAGTLRIILIVFGVLLLGALYLWERRRIERDSELDDETPERSISAWRREPSFGASFADTADELGRTEEPSETAADASRRTDAEVASHGRDAPVTSDDQDSNEADHARVGGSEDEAPEPAAAGASSVQQQRPESTSPGNEGSLLMQLFVVARGKPFDGSAVQAVAERQHLTPGEMDIYHRQNLESNSQSALFSMANLVKPGTFPFDEMETFTTPGVALFTQLEGLPSDLMVYDELVQAARSMADALDGDLLLPDRRPFDDAAWEGLRNELLSLINERSESV